MKTRTLPGVPSPRDMMTCHHTPLSLIRGTSSTSLPGRKDCRRSQDVLECCGAGLPKAELGMWFSPRQACSSYRIVGFADAFSLNPKTPAACPPIECCYYTQSQTTIDRWTCRWVGSIATRLQHRQPKLHWEHYIMSNVVHQSFVIYPSHAIYSSHITGASRSLAGTMSYRLSSVRLPTGCY